MIALPKLVPASAWNSLSSHCARRNPTRTEIVEVHKLDVNACVDSTSWMPILMEALLSYGFSTEQDRLPLLKYLLDKGANPNITCVRRLQLPAHCGAAGTLHLCARPPASTYNADVNTRRLRWLQHHLLGHPGLALRREGADRVTYLKVVEKILRLGADLDHEKPLWYEHPALARSRLRRCPRAGCKLGSRQTRRPPHHPLSNPSSPTNLRYPTSSARSGINSFRPGGAPRPHRPGRTPPRRRTSPRRSPTTIKRPSPPILPSQAQ